MIEIIIFIWGKLYWQTFLRVSLPSISNSIRFFEEANPKNKGKIVIVIWSTKDEVDYVKKMKKDWPHLNIKFKKVSILNNGVQGQIGNLGRLIKENNKSFHINKKKVFIKAKIKYVIQKIKQKAKKTNQVLPSFLSIYRSERKLCSMIQKGIVYVPADMIWSENFISTIFFEYTNGIKALYAIYLRGCEEKIKPKILKNMHKNGFFSARNLVKIALQNPHPLTCAHFKNSVFFPDHYEYYFEKKETHVEAKCFATTVTMFRFGAVLLDSFFKTKNIGLTSSICLITDSDRMFAISLTPITKDWFWLLSFPNKNSQVLNKWKSIFSDRLFRKIEKIPIIFRYK